MDMNHSIWKAWEEDDKQKKSLQAKLMNKNNYSAKDAEKFMDDWEEIQKTFSKFDAERLRNIPIVKEKKKK